MRLFSVFMLATLCAGMASTVSAQEYMFTYSKLYSQLKHNVKESHQDVKVGYFFTDAESQQLCHIEKAWMEKEKHYEKLQPTENNELIVPLDENLRQANPLVFVDTPNHQRCDFSMVVMTKAPLEGKVSYAEVGRLLPQMQSMLEDLGGMFSSWFTPEVTGVTLEFAGSVDSQIALSNGDVIDIVKGKAQVTLAQIGEDGWMQLPMATRRVLPYIPSAKK